MDIDITRSFRGLFNAMGRLLTGEAPSTASLQQAWPVKSDAIITDRPTMFESNLLESFKRHQHDPSVRFLRVSVIPHENGSYFFADPTDRSHKVRATYDIKAMPGSMTANEIATSEKNGAHTVMVLDLWGHEPERQIPNWRNGSIRFPSRFVRMPFYAPSFEAQLIAPPREGKVRERRHKVCAIPPYLRVIEGGP